VIDADVLRASGLSDHPRSRACRDFLLEVLHVCHRAAVTPVLTREWQGHASDFGIHWQAAMQSRGKITRLGGAPKPELRRTVEDLLPAAVRQIALKDIHLVECALDADRRVVSLDEHARMAFRPLTERCPSLKQVVWVNPERAGREAVLWLREGAPYRERWSLGTDA
jgi:hypothetical protein